jgi:hypothetical protein
LFVK